jgi:hypothetical protein
MAVQTNVIKERARAPEVMKPTQIADLADSQAKQMQNRSANQTAELEKLKQIGADLKAALTSGDIDKAKLLQADFKSARESVATDTKDLAQVMFAIGQQYDSIGISIDSLKEFSDEEKAIIAGPTQVLETRKGELEIARRALQTEELAPPPPAWKFLAESKDDKVNKAKAAVTAAETKVAEAQEAVKTAETIAQQQRRERLIEASLEQSLNRLMAVTDQAIQIATGRIATIEEDLRVVSAGVIDVSSSIEKLTTEVSGFDTDLERMDASIRVLESEMSEHAQNQQSPEYAALQTRLREANTLREQKVSDRTKSFMLLQEQQRFIEQFTLHQTVQQQSLEFHRAWIATLELANSHRAKLFKSQIGAMQAAGDQEAMSIIDAAATEVDKRGTKTMAELAIAGRRGISERVARMPDEIKALRDITKANVEDSARFEAEMAKMAKLFQQNYGDDASYASVSLQKERIAEPAGAGA